MMAQLFAHYRVVPGLSLIAGVLSNAAQGPNRGYQRLALFLQDPNGISLGEHADLFLVLIGVIAFAALVQAALTIGMGIAAMTARKKIVAEFNELKSRINPILLSTRAVIEDTAPKVKTISSNLVEASNTLRERASTIGEAVDEIAARTRQQAARVDGMVTDSLNGVEQVTTSVQHGVMAPIRQVQGVLNGFRAGIDVLLSRGRASRPVGRSRDEDLFI